MSAGTGGSCKSEVKVAHTQSVTIQFYTPTYSQRFECIAADTVKAEVKAAYTHKVTHTVTHLFIKV